MTGAAAAACVLAAVLAAVLLPSRGTPPAGTGRARQYLTSFGACLLTDAHGLAGAQAAQAWAGMQAASLATHARVEYLPVAGAQTTGGALPYLASLVQRRCTVVVALGSAPVAVVTAEAGRFKAVTFAVVGGRASAPNVTAIPAAGPSQVKTPVDRVITSAVHTS